MLDDAIDIHSRNDEILDVEPELRGGPGRAWCADNVAQGGPRADGTGFWILTAVVVTQACACDPAVPHCTHVAHVHLLGLGVVL